MTDDLWGSVPDTPQGGTFFRYSDLMMDTSTLLRFEEEPGPKAISTLETTVWEARVKFRSADPDASPEWREALLCPTKTQASGFKPFRPLQGKTFLLIRTARGVEVRLSSDAPPKPAPAKTGRLL